MHRIIAKVIKERLLIHLNDVGNDIPIVVPPKILTPCSGDGSYHLKVSVGHYSRVIGAPIGAAPVKDCATCNSRCGDLLRHKRDRRNGMQAVNSVKVHLAQLKVFTNLVALGSGNHGERLKEHACTHVAKRNPEVFSGQTAIEIVEDVGDEFVDNSHPDRLAVVRGRVAPHCVKQRLPYPPLRIHALRIGHTSLPLGD